jgi:CheY-like chemotaxis protein
VKILVIEDQPTQLKLAHHVLAAAGHEVSDAVAAEHAFTAIKMNRPQIILLDLFLPGIDGLTLVRKLKADPDTRDIHVVAVTSYPEAYPKAVVMAAGCEAYFVKPIDTRDLPRQLDAIAAGGGGIAALSKAKTP